MIISLERFGVVPAWALDFKKQLYQSLSVLPRGCVYRKLYTPTMQGQDHLLLECWVTPQCLRTAKQKSALSLPPEAFAATTKLEVYRMTDHLPPVHEKATLTLHHLWSDRLEFRLQVPGLAVGQHWLLPQKQQQPKAILTFWREPMPLLARTLYRQALIGIKYELEVYKPYLPRMARKTRLTLEQDNPQALAAD